MPTDTPVITEDDRRALLSLARRALEARVRRQPPPSASCTGTLGEARAAFVSIHRHGELRGCLGRLEWDVPLGDLVVELARDVADSDPRFEPVSPVELGDLQLEISVLSPSREVGSVEEIEVGRHGLIVEHEGHRGLLLPQVAVEHGWTREALLEHTCRKAGLAADAWTRGARVLVFEAHVFGES